MKQITRLLLSLLAAGTIAGQAGEYKYSDDLEKTIGPKSSEPHHDLNCSNPNLWQGKFPNRPLVYVSKAGKDVEFTWNGKAVRRYAVPLYGFVESKKRIPLIKGFQGKTRIIMHLAFDKLSFDALLRPVLINYDASGKEICRYSMLDPDFLYQYSQVTAPGKYRRICRDWNPPANAASVALGFEFMGNSMNVRLHSVRLEGTQKKVLWNVIKRHKTRVPDVCYDNDGAVPTPDVPLLNDAQVTELLKTRKQAIPKLERGIDRVKLTINGKEEPFVIHMSPLNYVGAYYQDMAKAGFKIATLEVRTGPCGDAGASPYNIWLGKDKYDFTSLKKAIRKVLTYVPDTYIILFVQVNVYNQWGVEHPGDIQVNDKGQKGIADWSRITRFGGAPPSGREFWEASNFSEQFRQDGAEVLKALGKWLNSVPEGKVVIGAYINGGADGQWLYSYEPQFSDYSLGALKAFRKYLKEKYKTDAALSKAWGKKTTFATAGFPPFKDRCRQFGPNPNVGRSPLMEHNNAKSQASDYNSFLSVANTRRQIAFAKGLKEGSNGRLLCGGYWPTLPAAYPLSHCDFTELLNCPDINFVSRGGLMGAVFHGKTTAGEFDLRNAKSGLDAWLDYDHPFIAKSQGDFRRQVIEGFCRELTSGGGFHLWDMWGGWFWHPQTMKIIKEGLEMTKYLKDAPPMEDNYVGVFIDDNAANYLCHLGRCYNIAAVQNTAQKMGWGWSSAWERAGVPVRFFTQEDALNPNLKLPKVAIFLNPLTMTLEQGAKIRKRFQKDKRVVVYMLSPGLAAPGTPENPAKITGFKIKEDAITCGRPLVIAAHAKDPLLKGIKPESQLGLWLDASQMAWYSNTSAAKNSSGKVLAHYSGTDLPGMLVDRKKDYTKVWIGAAGCVSPRLIRNFCREAGMTPIASNGSAVMIGAGLLGIVGTPAGGPQVITLPEKYKIEKCITGHKYTVKGRELKFTLGTGDIYGDVAIFSVGAAK